MEETPIIGTLKQTPLSSSFDHPNNPHHRSTLPFDLVEEILCRLPVKSLLPFRRLSKSLNTLISDPKFTKKQLLMSPKIHHLIVTSDDYNISSYPLQSIFNSVSINPTQLNYPFKEKYFSIVGSCDGIVCLEIQRYCVVLWNPFIGKFKILPCLKNSIDGCYGTFGYGFGYDPLIDNYMVGVFSHTIVYKIQLNVFTLGTNSWRKFEGDFPFPIGGSLKFLNGAINWFAFRDQNYYVVSFDLVNESFRKILLPNIERDDMLNENLGVLRGCLCIVVSSRTFSNVWLMKEYGNDKSWAKLFRVPSYMDGQLYFPYTKVIWISDDDHVLLECRALSEKKKLVVYCLKSGTFQIRNIQNINALIDLEVCIESLISPCF